MPIQCSPEDSDPAKRSFTTATRHSKRQHVTSENSVFNLADRNQVILTPFQKKQLREIGFSKTAQREPARLATGFVLRPPANLIVESESDVLRKTCSRLVTSTFCSRTFLLRFNRTLRSCFFLFGFCNRCSNQSRTRSDLFDCSTRLAASQT